MWCTCLFSNKTTIVSQFSVIFICMFKFSITQVTHITIFPWFKFFNCQWYNFLCSILINSLEIFFIISKRKNHNHPIWSTIKVLSTFGLVMCSFYKNRKIKSSMLADFSRMWNFWIVFRTASLFKNGFEININ